ncbi:hypothetical protein GCM10009718_33080 [Isoptericola halotolerans]|uniref:Uncharacterized protein n=1 Tax=Isoptericola halotolerans TaxID=300560 RepID=A0ABX2A6B9_9MICO|nr:hypothetical protein [Isoptericola halotolerans]NOV98196.1 hypothetical protein [Isoptericola halotolerans]
MSTDHRARCATHHHRLPCPMHAADHKAGDHTGRPQADCPDCATPAPTPDAARAAGNDLEDS